MTEDKQTKQSKKLGLAGRIADLALVILSIILALMLILYGGYAIYDSFYLQSQAGNWNLSDYKPVIIDDGSVPLDNSNSLAKETEDYRAWLTINETNIDYPVVQYSDDLYYASHDVFGQSSITGAIYLSAANTQDFSDNYNLVYGHHIDADVMFGSLDHFAEQSYFDAHREGIVVTKDKVYDLYTFAMVRTDAYDGIIYGPGNVNLDVLRAHLAGTSIIYDQAIASSAVKIVALSTCMDAETNGRYVLFAKMTERSGVVVQPDPGQGSDQTVIINNQTTPQGSFFDPRGNVNSASWALINLICVILTFYFLLPIFHIRAKYRRPGLLSDVEDGMEQMEEQSLPEPKLDTEEGQEEEDETEESKKMRRKLLIGTISNILISIIAIIVFILTEDMRTPMVLIDRYTPLMLLILLAAWLVDRILARRKKSDMEDMEEQLAEFSDQQDATTNP